MPVTLGARTSFIFQGDHGLPVQADDGGKVLLRGLKRRRVPRHPGKPFQDIYLLEGFRALARRRA
jgi:hypothetical protein